MNASDADVPEVAAVQATQVYERLLELAIDLAQLVDHSLGAYGISRSRAQLMWHVQRHGPATQRQLSDALHCSARNVTGLVDALEREGLVSREGHPDDRRVSVVTLTDAGSALFAELTARAERGARELFTGVDSDDLGVLARVVDDLVGRTSAAITETRIS